MVYVNCRPFGARARNGCSLPRGFGLTRVASLRFGADAHQLNCVSGLTRGALELP